MTPPDEEIVTIVNTQNWFSRILPRALKLFIEFVLLAVLLGFLIYVLLRFAKRHDLEQRVTVCQHSQQRAEQKIAQDTKALDDLEQKAISLKAEGQISAYNKTVKLYNEARAQLETALNVYDRNIESCNAVTEEYNQAPLVESGSMPRLTPSMKQYIRSFQPLK